MKILLLALTLVLPHITSNATEHTVVRQYVHPVVITQPAPSDRNTQNIIGSGSVVSIQQGYVLTAAHIVPTTSRETLYVIHNDRRVRATPIKIDRLTDLALLSVNIPCPCAPLGLEPPPLDHTIFAVGFPLFTTYRIQLLTAGTVQGVYAGNIVTTTTTAPGGSGGGVFVKGNQGFELVGVTVAIGSNTLGPKLIQIEQEYNWLSFSVPINEVRSFLKGTPTEPKKAPKGPFITK